MSRKIILKKMLNNCDVFRGTFPGIYDYDVLIDSDTDGYDPYGNILFKFRKNILSDQVNNVYPKLADICGRTVSLRSDAVGHQIFEESRVIGYALNQRSYNCVSETKFTQSEHTEYKKITPLIEMVNGIYKHEFPQPYYDQERLNVDPHFLIGRTVFSQCILNRSFRTCLHRDRSNVEGTMSNMICLGNSSYSGGYLVLPEYRVAINLRPKDYLGFNGREIWHGNTEIKGAGTRLTIVCYIKKELLGKSHTEELIKFANSQRV